MIDNHQLTNFERTDAELEEFLLYCIAAAGHEAWGADTALVAVLQALYQKSGMTTPFAAIRPYGIQTLHPILRQHKMRTHVNMARFFKCAAESGLDLRTASVRELERIPGIGQRTSRRFILHTRQGARVAILDNAIMRWMQAVGLTIYGNVNEFGHYLVEEKAFLAECDRRGLEPVVLDARARLTVASWPLGLPSQIAQSV